MRKANLLTGLAMLLCNLLFLHQPCGYIPSIDTKATINYNFLDYSDVPEDELALNPPADGSAPIRNPK